VIDERDIDDDRGEPDTTLEQECDRCGVEYRSPARSDTARDIEGYRYQGPPSPTMRYCPACEELGAAPPECPGCIVAKLRGSETYGEEGRIVPCFECDGCDAEYPIEVMRAILLGRVVEELVRDWPRISRRIEGAARAWDLVLRAAARLGVRR